MMLAQESDTLLVLTSIRTAIRPAASGVGGVMVVLSQPLRRPGGGETRDVDPGAGGALREELAEEGQGQPERVVAGELDAPRCLGVVLAEPPCRRSTSAPEVALAHWRFDLDDQRLEFLGALGSVALALPVGLAALVVAVHHTLAPRAHHAALRLRIPALRVAAAPALVLLRSNVGPRERERRDLGLAVMTGGERHGRRDGGPAPAVEVGGRGEGGDANPGAGGALGGEVAD